MKGVIDEVRPGTGIERIAELQPEESPVGESKSNGEVERATQTAQGHIRTLKPAMEGRSKLKIRDDRPIWQ